MTKPKNPVYRWPPGWACWPVTSEAVKRASERFLAELPGYPTGRFSGRGIVIAAGGRYWPSAYVTVRMIRHSGCRLPIQVWYCGSQKEGDSAFARLLQPFDVQLVDADKVRKKVPARIQGGFQLKLYAVMNSPWEEVLYLDADSYPVRDPAMLFDLPEFQSTGAIMWADRPETEAWIRWDLWQIKRGNIPSLDSGQFLLNKRICWRQARLAQWYNEHSDATYHWDYGDKGALRAAWTKLGRDPWMFASQPQVKSVAFVHAGPEGKPLFVHRINDKFRFSDEKFFSAQRSVGPRRCADLPAEDVAWDFFLELQAEESRRRDEVAARRRSALGLPPLTGYICNGGGGNPAVRALTQSLNGTLVKARGGLRPGGAIIWGVLRGSERLLHEALRLGQPFYYIDRPYLSRRSTSKQYRVTRDGLQAGDVLPRPADRWKAFRLTLRPWRKGGREIIVCPPTPAMIAFWDEPARGWLNEALQTLARHTDRPIVVRHKPGPKNRVPPLEEVLRTAHALVTYNSNAAVEAILEGVPVFTSELSAAAPVGLTDLARIEDPVRPDRQPWCHHLAYGQFTQAELRDGTAAELAPSGPGLPVISEAGRRLNSEWHVRDEAYGTAAREFVDRVRQLAHNHRAATILDYGCGKQVLQEALRDEFQVRSYDPAFPETRTPRQSADMLACIDVLEHVEPDCLTAVVADIARLTRKVAFLTCSQEPSPPQSDGTHCQRRVESADWWRQRLDGYFRIDDLREEQRRIQVVAVPRRLSAGAAGRPEQQTPSRIAVVTSFNRKLYESYGWRFVESFERYWPAEVQLYLYAEDCAPRTNGHVRDLLQCCPELVAFKLAHSHDPGENPNSKKNTFRFDAVRFAHKVFAIVHATRNTTADKVFWVDADVVTFAPIPLAFLDACLPDDCYTSCLKRKGMYSECGFVGYNLRHPAHQEFMQAWEDLYTSGRLFDLAEWHDSFVYDHLRRSFEAAGKFRSHNLSGPHSGATHPFVNSDLGRYMDHLKGKRKSSGKSRRSDLKTARPEAYWR